MVNKNGVFPYLSNYFHILLAKTFHFGQRKCPKIKPSEIFTVQYKTFKNVLSWATRSHVFEANIHDRARTRIGYLIYDNFIACVSGANPLLLHQLTL